VTFFAHTAPPSDDDAEQLAAREIRLVEPRVASLDIVDGRLAGVRLDDGTTVACDAFVVMTRLVARASFLDDLGLAPAAHPSGFGDHIPVDATGRTSVPGVWAAGNVTDIAAQVGAAAAGGALAAAQINADLATEDTARAVAAHRAARAVSR
jgi:thioredoxin reductase